MTALRTILAAHALAWSQTFQLLAGAIIPGGAQRKNRTARVYKLVGESARTEIIHERTLKPGEKLRGGPIVAGEQMHCAECDGILCDGDPCNFAPGYCHKTSAIHPAAGGAHGHARKAQ